MTNLAIQETKNPVSATALNYAARAWYVVAFVGLSIFALYVLLNYGGGIISANDSAAKEIGFEANDPAGNVSLFIHLLTGVFVTFSGLLQLLPTLRIRWPTFHRWNGRMLIMFSMLAAIAGIYLISTRPVPGGWVIQLAFCIDALLIIWFGWLTFRTAVRRDFAKHRVWALRLFLVCNAGWFFRIGLMFWFMLHQAPVGLNPETFTGPTITFLAFAQMVVPLAMLELYLYTQRHNNHLLKGTVALMLFVCVAVTLVGVLAATMGMWLPRIT